MSYFLSEEQVLIKNAVKDFVDQELRPRAAEIDKSDEFPMDMWKRCAELGFCGVSMPEALGGLGLGLTTEMVVMEELGRVCPALGLSLNVSYFALHMIRGNATEEQQAKYVPPLAKGEKIGAFASSEAPGSINMSEWPISAVLDGDCYVVNGTKVFITNAAHADILVLTVKTAEGIKRVICETSLPGVSSGYIERKLGLHGSDTGTIHFKDVRVPVENLMGSGFNPYANGTYLDIAAICLGIMEEAYDTTYAHLAQRTKKGKKLYSLSAVGQELAIIATKIELARNLIYNSALMFEQGDPVTALSCMCKAWVSEAAVEVASRCIELQGGVGYSEDNTVAKLLRDAQGFTIAELSTGIQWARLQKALKIPVEMI